MSRKKHPEHVNHERWLVSYADFITLLFAFFVVLFASGQSDKKKQQQFASAFASAFSQMALFEPHSKQPALMPGAGANTAATPVPLELPLATPGAEVQQQIEQIVKQQVAKEMKAKGTGIKPGELTVRSMPEGVALTLHEGGFFASGSAEILPRAVTALQQIVAQLPNTEIRVEGHTDDMPIHSAQFASNWELSSARAAAIAHFLLEHSHIDPAHVAVAGYAEFRPLASNTTPEGRAQNRRVDIVFLKSAPATTKETPAGGLNIVKGNAPVKTEESLLHP